METLREVITTYGYYALFLGTFAEGETMLLLAGFMAHQGLMALPSVMMTATLGATLGDQLYFYLGRYHYNWIFAHMPYVRKKAEKIHLWVEKYPNSVIIGSRFCYGFRIACPILMGTSRIPSLRYSVLNFIGAVIWAVLMSCLGYFLGNMTEVLLGDLQHIQFFLFGLVIIVGVSLWLVHRLKFRS